MCQDLSSSWLLGVFVLLCSEVVLSQTYANFSEAAGSYRRHHAHHSHQPQSHKMQQSASNIVAMEDDIESGRIPKLFSFHALDDDVTVDLEFAVPFVNIPIKKSMEKSSNAIKSLVNLNTPALVLAGLFVVVGAGFGLLFNTFVGKTTGVKRKSRITDISNLMDPFKLIYRNGDAEKSETAFADIVQIIENKFNENNVDITACIQKSICSLVQKSADRVRVGSGTGTNKIVDGLASSEWFLQYLEGTAVKDAIDAGSSPINCSYKYSTCRWTSPEKHVMKLALGLIDF